MHLLYLNVLTINYKLLDGGEQTKMDHKVDDQRKADSEWWPQFSIHPFWAIIQVMNYLLFVRIKQVKATFTHPARLSAWTKCHSKEQSLYW